MSDLLFWSLVLLVFSDLLLLERSKFIGHFRSLCKWPPSCTSVRSRIVRFSRVGSELAAPQQAKQRFYVLFSQISATLSVIFLLNTASCTLVFFSSTALKMCGFSESLPPCKRPISLSAACRLVTTTRSSKGPLTCLWSEPSSTSGAATSTLRLRSLSPTSASCFATVPSLTT